MAFTDYKQSPKVVTEGERVNDYATLTDFAANWTDEQGRLMHTRLLQTDSTRTERYRFMGLTEHAAMQCAEAERVKHTKVKNLFAFNQQAGVIEYTQAKLCVAEITPRRVGDTPMFEVDVYVNDKTSTLSRPKFLEEGAST